MCVLTGEGRSVPSGHGLRLYRLNSRLGWRSTIQSRPSASSGAPEEVSSVGMRKPFLARGEVPAVAGSPQSVT
jgi:hypothetical protein